MNIQKSNIKAQNVAFSGHNKKLDKKGYETHNFFYLYDPEKYDCEVELYNISKDRKGNLSVGDMALSRKMPDGYVSIDVDSEYKITSDIGFAYRFKLTDKDTQEVSYAFDNGTVAGIFDKKDKYNVILSNRAVINKNGVMQLIMPDEYYPGIKNVDGKPTLDTSLRAKALASVRTHANKLGGNFYGIIKRLDDLRKEGVSRIVGTPYTKDTISSHLYWTENAFRVCPNLGSEEDFKKLQEELCKRGINWISDAALVNEGFGGIHLSALLRKGSDSYAKDMFRADEKISLGILPDNCAHTRMKMINTPFLLSDDGVYESHNPQYDSSKPTYVQFYDERLASEEQVNSDSPMRMTTYDYNNTDNIYEITRHDDAVYPFPIEVDPAELKRNVQNLYKENGNVDKTDIDTIKAICDFANFNVENKSAASGLEVWDGNVDIAKLNFYRCNKDDSRFTKLPEGLRQEAIRDFDRGALAVRDYALNSGRYWTKLAADTQLKYISDLLGCHASSPSEYMAIIEKAVSNGMLPESALENIDEEIINNVITGEAYSRRLDDADCRADINNEEYGNGYDYEDYILRQVMDVPLETVPAASNLIGVLTSPYIAKKANTSEELAVSRYDLYKASNPNLPKKYAKVYSSMDNLYKEQILPLMTEILDGVAGLQDPDGRVSDYGKFVISEIAPDLTKYLLLKALDSDANVKVEGKGDFDFSGVDESKITIQSLGIPYSGMSQEEEAAVLVKKLRNGIADIPQSEIDELKQKMQKRFEIRSLNDYKIAEMIMDRTDSGLGWRIDAAKDIASIDSVRAGVDSAETAWKNVINFWKKYNEVVLSENRHAYTVAEITDLYDLIKAEMPIVYQSDPLAQTDESDFTKEELAVIEKIKEIKAKNNGNLDVGKLQGEQKAVYEKAEKVLREKIQKALDSAVFTSDADAERKFLEETGITAIANYSYFFSLLPEMFSHYSFENGGSSWMSTQEMNHELRNKLDKGWNINDAFGIPNTPGFLFQSPDDGVANSYTFLGNHDKPRPLHCLALDMSLFYSDFSNEAHRKIAKEVLGNIEDFDKVSAPAVAMGSRLNEAFSSVVSNKKELNAIKQAIRELASGTYKGEKFDATAFGTKPVDIVIKTVLEQVNYDNNDVKISDKRAEQIKAKTFENILASIRDRYYSMYKLLMILPGSPTDFAGDRVAATGAETKAKNYYQQNRNIINWEWLDNPEYKFVREFYDKINQIANLRNNPALSALNDGNTVTIPIMEAKKDDKGKITDSEPSLKTQAVLRYNEDSVVLAITNLSGAQTAMNKPMERKTTELSTEDNVYNRIVLSPDKASDKQGLKHGLTLGTKFKNARRGDDSVYQVCKMTKNGKEYYYLKRMSAKTGQELPIQIKPEDLNTLVLYKV